MIFYFFWTLVTDVALLIIASFFPAFRAAGLWCWFGASVVAYFGYEVLLPEEAGIRIDLVILYPLFLVATLACVVRSLLRK